ncbi:MAG: NAD(P)H-hydrate dehydratase [Candidatus Omnitrophica bacterium]|nr:NAD(P)H-hydrate dehydratase [Candidatus Omnitrophota bacterium]
MKKKDADFLRREKNAHKGDFGHVFVLAGSRGFTGAAVFCAKAALLSGAGLVTVGIPEGEQTIVAIKLTEAMTLALPQTNEGTLSTKAFGKINDFLKRCDMLAIGPGLSRNKSTQNLVRRIIREIDVPMVIDADALNALQDNLSLLKRKSKFLKIITPHPGEMARLVTQTTEQVQKNRRALAKQLSCMYNMVTVLKGNATVICDNKGNLTINNTGNPGLAKGGSGDVLTGIIAAFYAQSQDAGLAARLGVYVHGLAADYAVREKGQVSLLATDVLALLPKAIKSIVD